MKSEFLGDSYDAVKRMWREMLADWAPLYAEPRFFSKEDEIRQKFTRLTGIQMLTGNPQSAYSILNDPDTGIRLPSEQNQAEGRTHITISTIIDQLRAKEVRCVITFDQSDYRNSGQSREEQRRAKMHHLIDEAFGCFYYVSHAPFLFATPNAKILEELQKILTGAGIPERRLQHPQ